MVGNTQPVHLPDSWKSGIFSGVDRLAATPRGQRMLTKIVEVGLTSLGAGNHDYSGDRTGENRLVAAIAQAFTELVAIDVGANHGSWFLELLSRAPQARVIAVEPGRGAVEILRERCGTDPRVMVVPSALGESCGLVELYGAEQADDLASLRPELLDRTTFAQLGREASSETVQMMTVEALAEEVGRASFADLSSAAVVVKVDVEGLELPIIEQVMTSRLRSVVQVLQFEFNMHALAQGQLLADFRALFGDEFRLYRLAPRCLIPVDEIGPNLANYFGFSNWVAIRATQGDRIATLYRRGSSRMHRPRALLR